MGSTLRLVLLALVTLAVPTQASASTTESATIPVRGDYPNGTSLHDALGGPGGTVNGGAVTVSVPARSGLVLVGGS